MERVLVLDANQRSALAVTRSLGAKGLHVVAADETRRTLAGSSRHCKETFVHPSPYGHPDDFVATVRRESAQRGVGVIFPMTDITTALLLQKQEQFDGFILPCSSIEAFDRLTDKWKLHELAQELGISIPQTVFLRQATDLPGALSQLAYPLVLKPHRSRIWTEGRWVTAEVKYAHSAQEAERIVTAYEWLSRHPFLVQEYIRGQAQGIFALYNQSEPVVFFAHKRLREKPPSGGVSVLSESVEVPPRLREIAHKILEAVKWHGVAMVEFKVAPDGTPYLMEVNARFWGSLQLAIDSGVDVPWLLYQVATGQTPDGIDLYKVGIRSRWLVGDFLRLGRILLGTGESGTTASGRGKAILDFLHFFDRNTRNEVNRWDDLKPFFFEVGQLLRRVHT
jgi:predicted ATP-grasp superfamily ATP-dependent carboligase